MKQAVFLGDSLKMLRDFPTQARNAAGRELERVQRGGVARDAKPLPAIGKGVEELRIWAETGTYRVVYFARLQDAVYVLHAFQKKTRATAKKDIDLARERLRLLLKEGL